MTCESTDSIVSSTMNATSNTKTPLLGKKNFEHSRNNSYGGGTSLTENANRSFGQHNKSNSNDLTNSSLVGSKTSSNFFSGENKSSTNSTEGFLATQKSVDKPTNLVVKVIIEFANPSESLKLDEKLVASTVMYKRIYVKNSDRTKDVKRAILEKFLLNPDTCDKYSLVQVNCQKDFQIDDQCNVYYAAIDVPDMQFVLRQRDTNGATPNNNNTNNNNVNNNSFNTQNNVTNGLSNGFKSPLTKQANKTAKPVATSASSKQRSKTQQLVQPNSYGSSSSRPPLYPNQSKT